MKELLKDEYAAYLDSFSNKPIHSLRVNTSKISPDEFIKIFPYKLERVPWSDDGFYFEDEGISKHPFYYAGLYYLQEASAMLPASLLEVEEGDIVFDGCAAPGGKSTKLLNKLNNTGLLISNDISASRCLGLLRNLERFGAERYFVTSEDIVNLSKSNNEIFDEMLIDAPCSGEGMFRKDSSLIKSWLEKGNDYYAEIQKQIIDASYKLLKKGGQLVYSTCTFDEKEDEDIIAYALNKYTDLKLLPIKMYDGFVKGKDNIGVKLYPHKIKGEGHFVCLLEKEGSNIKNKASSYLATLPDFPFFKSLNKQYENGAFEIIKEKLYFVPNNNLLGYRIIRSGLLMGEIKNGRFEPSQALAMSLKSNEFKSCLKLNEDDPRVLKYLKGETIKVPEIDNEEWVLVCVKDYPLGFGKISNNVLKNKIDKGWIYK